MKQKRMIWTVFILLPAFSGLVLLPEQSAEAVREGLGLCSGVIIPALFPFLVLTSLTISLGLAAPLGRILHPLLGSLLGISPAGAGAFALGMVGGYPVGAGGVRQLWETGQCSREECACLLTFCNNCGPAFLLSIAGGTVFHSVKMGLLLWMAHLLGAVTTGMVLRRRQKRRGMAESAPSCPVRCVSFSKALTDSVQRGIRSTAHICAYVVLFRVILRFCYLTGAEAFFAWLPNGNALFCGLLELSTGVTAIDPMAAGAAVTASFLLGMGGLSVWCQTAAVLEGSGLPVRQVFVGKVLHGVFAALWSVFLLRLFPQELPTAALSAVPMLHRSLGWLPVAVTGGSWGIFALSLRYFSRNSTGKSRRNRV